WMQSRHRCEVQIQPEFHLIVTEGTQTEPMYFEAIRQEINQHYRDRIQLEIHGEGDNTLSLLERAKSRVRNSGLIYKHVWIVYDTDDFPAERINQTETDCNVLSQANEETIYHAVWSNQCIELWFMLHFNYVDADLHRSEYYPKLSEWLQNIGQGEYAKNRRDIYAVLRPYLDTAIRNARKLDKRNQGRTPAGSAPGTKVYELLALLRPYLL
ncbi:MAG: RloB domain-containing protein, partial [Oscillospiraceae bacterium]|nr:RloB domain-containing protein [Oscillospiraceae bacterium]